MLALALSEPSGARALLGLATAYALSSIVLPGVEKPTKNRPPDPGRTGVGVYVYIIIHYIIGARSSSHPYEKSTPGPRPDWCWCISLYHWGPQLFAPVCCARLSRRASCEFGRSTSWFECLAGCLTPAQLACIHNAHVAPVMPQSLLATLTLQGETRGTSDAVEAGCRRSSGVSYSPQNGDNRPQRRGGRSGSCRTYHTHSENSEIDSI